MTDWKSKERPTEKAGTQILIWQDGPIVARWEEDVPHPAFMDAEGNSYFDFECWAPISTPKKTALAK